MSESTSYNIYHTSFRLILISSQCERERSADVWFECVTFTLSHKCTYISSMTHCTLNRISWRARRAARQTSPARVHIFLMASLCVNVVFRLMLPSARNSGQLRSDAMWQLHRRTCCVEYSFNGKHTAADLSYEMCTPRLLGRNLCVPIGFCD